MYICVYLLVNAYTRKKTHITYVLVCVRAIMLKHMHLNFDIFTCKFFNLR